MPRQVHRSRVTDVFACPLRSGAAVRPIAPELFLESLRQGV